MPRATGKDVILAIGENMHASLEPLVTKTLAPSLFQVYLHPDDYDHLRTIFGELETEAKRHLDAELATLNNNGSTLLGKVRSRLGRGESDDSPPRFVAADGAWHIRFQEDPNGALEPGDVEVVSELAVGQQATYGAGSKTHRISTTRRLGEVTASRKTVADAPAALATFEYEDDSGPHVFRMTREEIVIGRRAVDVWVDLRLDTSLDVSREHARVRRESDGTFRIKDLSQYGTTVDGLSVPASVLVEDGVAKDLDHWVDLADGAVIELASVVTLTFRRAR